MAPPNPDELVLTPSQLRVFLLALEGFGDDEIGRRLYLSRQTVSGYLRDIRDRIGVDASDSPRWLAPIARRIGREELRLRTAKDPSD